MDASERLRPFVAGFALDWLRDCPDRRHRVATGTLVFVDISGFTRLTERLAARGKIGAEEMSDLLDVTFAALLAVAYDYGSWLVKWGGDAVLLFFEGDDNARRACTAAFEMRRTLRTVGRLRTSVGQIQLRMSAGVHTGVFDFFFVGNLHRELVLAGQAATRTVEMEAAATAGEIVISAETAGLLRPAHVGRPKETGFLLARSPRVLPDLRVHHRDVTGIDVRACLPEVTSNHLLAGETDGEHRLVSVAFVELSGVEAISARSGPDGVADAIDYVIRTCQEAAQRHEVTFWETDISADGVKVMLVSGAPRGAGQEEDRMLAVVREILDAGGRLRLRAGMNSGRVFAGEFGPPFRRTYSVKGDAVNVAARLMSKAGTGEVYASEAVMARARTAYTTDLLPPLTVKGKSRPLTAYRVREALGAAVISARIDLPFAGRADELAQLLAAMAEARGGTGQVWEIEGDPGIGKSRLVAELVKRAHAATVLSLTCDQYHATTPYAAFRRPFRQLLGVADDAAPSACGAALVDVVARTAPSLLTWTPLLAAIVGAEVDSTTEVDALEPKFRKSRREEHAVQFLATLVPGTMLIVAEDIHLMDDASRDLLRRVRDVAVSRGWLVVTTTRPVSGEATEDIGAVIPSARRMVLRPLPNEAVGSLVKLGSEEHPLPPHEMALLAKRSGGNPLFLQELLAAMRGGGTVSSLPDSVEGVVAAQIDRLLPVERTILRVAAVLGVRIDERVFAEMLRTIGLELADPVAPLKDFLQADAAGLHFRHTLARDTAYEGLPYRRRQVLHGLAGDVIERLAEDRADDVADLLSMHFLQARNYSAAWRYARKAGDRATQVHAQVEAVELYERALEAAARAPGVASSDIAEAAEALGDARYKLGTFADAMRAYLVALPLRDDAVSRARLHFKRSLVADRAGQLRSATRFLTQADRQLADARDAASTTLRAQVRAQRGLIRHWQGRDVEAIKSLREAVALAEAAGADDALATALTWLDNCEMTLGTHGAGEHATRALEIWRAMGNRPWEEARVLNQLGIRAYFEGRWDDAVAHYRESKLACDRAGDQFTAAVEFGNMAEVLSDQGHLAEAEPLLRDADLVWRAANAPSFIAFGKSQRGRLAARSGHFAVAMELLHAARDDYLRYGEQAELLETDARLAECLLLRGDFDEALRAADSALQRVASMSGLLAQIPSLQRVRGLALAYLGHRENAFDALRISLQAARERSALHEVAWTLDALLMARARAGLASDDVMSAERARLFDQLGIVRVARPMSVMP